jgi:hypothetical protein
MGTRSKNNPPRKRGPKTERLPMPDRGRALKKLMRPKKKAEK